MGRFLKIVGWIELATAVQAGRGIHVEGRHVVLISMVADDTSGNHLAHFVHRKARECRWTHSASALTG
jgi:hypothetical protein